MNFFGRKNKKAEENIENLLNTFLLRLKEMDNSSGNYLMSFLSDIVDREKNIYPRHKGHSWQYKMVGNSHCFLLRGVQGNVMSIIIDVTSDNNILSFKACYLCNLSNYGYSERIGTMYIEVNCSGDNIEYEDKIYSMDLLNNSFDGNLEDILVSNFYNSLIKGRKL